MYVARSDWKLGIAVWWCEGIFTDAEWEETFRHRRELCAHSPGLSFRPAVLLYVESERASPLRRKQLADLSDHPAYNPYIAFISTDQEVRGVQTAMRWIGQSPHYDKELFETIEPGLTWLEEKRGMPLPALRKMAGDVRRMAARGGAAGASSQSRR